MACVATVEGCTLCAEDHAYEHDCDDACRLAAKTFAASEISHRVYHEANRRQNRES